MSNYLPFDVQFEIVKRLPVKSLIRFRSVSKPWKSLIDSSEFIADYNSQSQQRRLLIGYRDKEDYVLKSVLIDDDDSFPQRKCSLDVPLFLKSIIKLTIIGSSHGILCLHGYHDDSDPETRDDVVLWNPAIRKSVVIKIPNDDELTHQIDTVVGFGVCPLTNDPKLVKINHIDFGAKLESISCIPSQVEVFTLSSRVWRTPYSRNLPRKSICFGGPRILIGGFIYWAAYDMTNVDEVYRLIISFDLTTEEFKEIYLPKSIAHSPKFFSVSKLRDDSLVVFDYSKNGENVVYGLWMMEHGVPNSFTKLFTIDAPNIRMLRTLLGFRDNGEPMFEMGVMDDHFSSTLDVYEPSSKHIKGLGINGLFCSFFVSSYMETLMMLDQQDIL